MIKLSAGYSNGDIHISIEDNGGSYSGGSNKGLGMSIVEKRIKNICGEKYGLKIDSAPDKFTRVTITLPAQGCRDT